MEKFKNEKSKLEAQLVELQALYEKEKRDRA